MAPYVLFCAPKAEWVNVGNNDSPTTWETSMSFVPSMTDMVMKALTLVAYAC